MYVTSNLQQPENLQGSVIASAQGHTLLCIHKLSPEIMRLLLRFISVPWNAIKLMAFEWIAEWRWHLRPVLFKGENGLPLHAGSVQSRSPPSVVITITWKHGECVCCDYTKTCLATVLTSLSGNQQPLPWFSLKACCDTLRPGNWR